MSEVSKLTAKELAYLLGVSEPTIFLWTKGGKWLAPSRVGRGQYDGKMAVKLYIENYIAPKYRGSKEGGESYEDAKRRKEIAQANLHELKESSLRGDLVEKDQAIKWLVALISEAKTAFVALPRRLAPVLYGMSDIRQIENELRSEIMKILEKLSRSSARRNGKKAVEIAQPEGKRQLQ